MSSSTSQYELLGVEPSASPDELKQSYRRQMARYHPDKLQHLGPEFVDLATKRSIELTHAYNAVRRQGIGGGESVAVMSPPPASEPSASDAQATVEDDFLARAALSTLDQVARSILGDVSARSLPGFDLALSCQSKRRLFRQSGPPLLVLGRVVPMVEPDGVQVAWRDTARLAGDRESLRCLFLMGAGMASARDLGEAISAQRRRPVRAGAGVVLIPVDLRTWQTLVPSEAPDSIKAIIGELQNAR